MKTTQTVNLATPTLTYIFQWYHNWSCYKKKRCLFTSFEFYSLEFAQTCSNSKASSTSLVFHSNRRQKPRRCASGECVYLVGSHDQTRARYHLARYHHFLLYTKQTKIQHIWFKTFFSTLFNIFKQNAQTLTYFKSHQRGELLEWQILHIELNTENR